MCGISGIQLLGGGRVDPRHLQTMNDRLAHRGPDASGTWVSTDETVGFAHRRLAIIDLSEDGRQPMVSSDGRFVITYNGEIYNYLELRKTLEDRGVRFRTATDIEVLLNAFITLGERCLQELDGMFAFAIFDNKTKTLFCARDRFGEKPFYYYLDNERFAFASEVKAILPVVKNAKVSPQRLQEFLDSGVPHPKPQDTFFQNIRALAPAHHLTLRDGRVSIGCYWAIDLSKSLRYDSRSEYVDHFAELFKTSIIRRLRSDVAVGFSLSGGLDSSSIVAAIAHGKLIDPVTTFSARFKDDAMDEGEWISNIVAHTGAVNHRTFPDVEAFLKDIRDLTYHLEVPIAGFSNFAQWSVMKLAREKGVSVLLDGQGADEVLGGYSPYRFHFLWDLYARGNLRAFRSELSHYRTAYGCSLSLGYLFRVAPFLKRFGWFQTLHPCLTVREAMVRDLTEGLPTLLQYADRTSMAYSLEVRLVYLFHEIAEFLFSIPDELLYHQAMTKSILRESMKGVLDEPTRMRKNKLQFAPSADFLDRNPFFQEKTWNAQKRIAECGFRPSGVPARDYFTAEFISVFS